MGDEEEEEDSEESEEEEERESEENEVNGASSSSSFSSFSSALDKKKRSLSYNESESMLRNKRVGRLSKVRKRNSNRTRGDSVFVVLQGVPHCQWPAFLADRG